MGYGEYGGNGSVEWKTDVGQADWTTDEKKNGGVGPGHRQAGVDKNGQPGEYFTVSMEVPRSEGDPVQYLTKLRQALTYDANSRRVWFRLEIEAHNPDQIRISWPPDPALPAA